MVRGKVGTAPCGHPGEYIIGQFVRCLVGCDDLDFVSETPTPTGEFEINFALLSLDECPFCHSDDVEDFLSPVGTMHCVKCGGCF